MKKITLFIIGLVSFAVNAQVVLIQENFQNWTAQATSGAYTITKTLADGTTNGTFSADKLIVAPTQSIGSAGTAIGNASPSTGRAIVGSTAGYLELPTLPTVGQILIKANIGTDQRTMKLQVKNGAIFEDIPNTTVAVNNAVTLLYTFNLTYSVPTTIRIVTSNSSLNIWDLTVSSYVSNLPSLPNAPAIGAASSINSEGFVANWSSVTNATGYIVKVYQSTNLISTYQVTGQTNTNFSIGGLVPNTSYSYTVIAKGDGINYANSAESGSAAVTTLNFPLTINTDFNDGTWGTAASVNYTAGAYPSSTINGFTFASAGLYSGSTKDNKGNSHTNRISIDKSSYSGKVILPAVSSLGQVEIHGAAGTAGNGITLKEYNTTTLSWDVIGTYIYEQAQKDAGVDSVYIIPITRNTPTKLSIENTSVGGYYLYQVITRTTNPTLLSKPIVGIASSISTTSFTANWTAVANATGYKVYVYQGTTLVAGSPFSVSGQSMEYLTISGLTAETPYTYKVIAVGDGFVNYSDSYFSAASTPVTTSTATSLNEPGTSNFVKVEGKTISISTTSDIQIFNLQGSNVFQTKSVNSVETNISCGLYIIRFTSKSGQQTIQKITIK